MNSRIGEISAGLDSDITSLQSDYTSNLEKFFNTSPNSISPSQSITQAILNLVPMIIGGAIAKKRGALAGVVAGTAAGKSFRTNIEAKNKQDQSKALVGLDRAQKQLDLKQKQKFDADKLEVTEAGKNSRMEENNRQKNNRTGQISSAMIRAAREGKSTSSAMTDSQIDNVAEKKKSFDRTKAAIKEVKALLPNEAKYESYTDDKGNFSFEKAQQVGKRMFDENFWGANSPAGQAQAVIEGIYNERIKEITGLSATDNAMKRYDKELKGAGATPLTIPIKLKMLERLAQIQGEEGVSYVKTVKKYRQGEEAGDIVDRAKEDFSMEDPPDLQTRYNELRLKGNTPEQISEILGLTE